MKRNLNIFVLKKGIVLISYDKLFRFDITAVKSSPIQKGYKYQKTFKGSDILRNKEKYEIEIEYIGSSSDEGESLITKFHKDLIDGKLVPSIYKFPKRKVLELKTDDYDLDEYNPEHYLYLDSPSYYVDPFKNIIGKRCFVKKDYWSKTSNLSMIYEKIKDESVFKEDMINGIIKKYQNFYEPEEYNGEILEGKYLLIHYALNNDVWIPVTEFIQMILILKKLYLNILNNSENKMPNSIGR